MMWKVLASVWFILAGFIVGVWFAHGMQTVTKTKYKSSESASILRLA